MELLVFWVITDLWQITEMLKELFRAQPLGFAGILSHSKILVVAALWGGIQEMTLDNCSSFFLRDSIHSVHKVSYC